jgi:phage shock protein PspC (stress-responsive transcriptional regulator)
MPTRAMGWNVGMDTTHAAAPTRPRWFAGLRRSRSRILGGVASGFAEFWAIDPLLIRVLVASPLLAAMLAMTGQVVLGMYWSSPLTQLLWLIAATTIVAYLVGWTLIPQPGSVSLARRFLGWVGPIATLVKLVVGFVLLIGFGWLGLGTLGYVGALDDLSPLMYVTGMLVTVGGLATLGVWLARGGDLRDALHRLGSPGFGRTDTLVPAVWADPVAGDAEPTLVLDVDGEPTVTMLVPDPASGEPTLVLDSVDRARAAATAAADARAAAAEAQRRARAEARRARRAERRERNRWGWLVAAVTLITAGALVLTDRAGATSLGWAGIAMVCLALLTTGVLVGAWFGSARWLIAPALLLAGLIGAGGLASDAVDRAASAPPTTVSPKELPKDEQFAMGWEEGTVTVDLTDTKELDSRMLTLTVDRGSLTVILPTDQWTEAYWEVMLGANNLTTGGPSVLRSGQQSLNSPVDMVQGRGAQPLYLDLHVGVGELTVIEEES